MTILAVIGAVLLMVLGVAFSIGWHELGHFLPAKRFGVRVPQFMIGFGPTIWSRRRGETQYGIKAIPLGGYVRMIGMFPPRAGDAPGTIRATSTGRFSQLVDEARSTSLEEVQPGDEDRVFYNLSVPRKLVIMLGGPTMNLILGVVLLTFSLTVHGVAEVRPGVVINGVTECVVPATDAARTQTCTPDLPKTPAYLAGLKPGDRVLTIDGVTMSGTADVGQTIRPRMNRSTAIVVERDGQQLTLTATPIRNRLAEVGPDGQAVRNADGSLRTVEAGFLGVMSGPVTAFVPQPISAVPSAVWDTLGRTAHGIVAVPEKLVGVWGAVTSDAERPVDSPMSVVGVGRVAGEIGSGQLDRLIGGDTQDKIFALIGLLAMLNFMLFVFNLVPLLPLDGGHVAGALWEGVRRRWARLRGRADPGPVDVARALPLAYAVSIALLAMSALLIYADIVKPIKLG